MSFSIKKLRSLTDNELIELHDKHAEHTVVGVNYFIEELERRSRKKSEESNLKLSLETHKLARRTYIQSWISAAASILALILSAISLNK